MNVERRDRELVKALKDLKSQYSLLVGQNGRLTEVLIAGETNPQPLKAAREKVKSCSNIFVAMEESDCLEEEQVLRGKSVPMEDKESLPVDGKGGDVNGDDVANEGANQIDCGGGKKREREGGNLTPLMCMNWATEIQPPYLRGCGVLEYHFKEDWS